MIDNCNNLIDNNIDNNNIDNNNIKCIDNNVNLFSILIVI